jgi:hypothetical protein
MPRPFMDGDIAEECQINYQEDFEDLQKDFSNIKKASFYGAQVFSTACNHGFTSIISLVPGLSLQGDGHCVSP